MSHVFELTDEQYEIIKEAAERCGRTPEDLFLAWALEEETVIVRRIQPITRPMSGFDTLA